MTYIAAFGCKDGIVMCADTQETQGDYKNYAEKLAIVGDRSYPLAIGGAGIGDLIDCLTDEIIESAKSSKPETKKDLVNMIRDAVRHVFENDAPVLVLGKQWRSAELLIGAKTNEGFCILRTKGKRVFDVNVRHIIGYPTEYNRNLLERLHRPDISMQQAVMLGIYLVSQSKSFDGYVGGDTSIAVVRDNGAHIDDSAYVLEAEQRVKSFLAITDRLFLSCIDVSIAPSDYQKQASAIMQQIDGLRDQYLRDSAARSLYRTLNDPTYSGEPYSKIFLGAVVEVGGSGTVAVRETTEQELANRREFMAAAMQGYNRIAGEKLHWFLTKDNRNPVYLGEEIVHIQGTAGPIPTSGVE